MMKAKNLIGATRADKSHRAIFPLSKERGDG
jgi:hypothetical protein